MSIFSLGITRDVPRNKQRREYSCDLRSLCVSHIEVRNVFKSYEDTATQQAVPVLEGLTLDVNQGEFVSVFGPNGCGKSTLLKIIADLIFLDSGTIQIGGKDSSETRVGFVFQDYRESLFPWLKNIDNIALSLHSNPGSKRHKREMVKAFIAKMGLEVLPLDKYPYQCSSGQQQLVALIRELIYEPDVLLMDEPFVSLDYDRRLSQHDYLLNSWHKTNITTLFISHDIDETIYLSDRLILLSKRPAKIVASYDITLPRPRTVGMLASEEFLSLKAPILQAFMETVGA